MLSLGRVRYHINPENFLRASFRLLSLKFRAYAVFADTNGYIYIYIFFPGQAYNLSRDHKPDLEVERERILKAGGFIHGGRVNGSLNLARAIGIHIC